MLNAPEIRVKNQALIILSPQELIGASLQLLWCKVFFTGNCIEIESWCNGVWRDKSGETEEVDWIDSHISWDREL